MIKKTNLELLTSTKIVVSSSCTWEGEVKITYVMPVYNDLTGFDENMNDDATLYEIERRKIDNEKIDVFLKSKGVNILTKKELNMLTSKELRNIFKKKEKMRI